MSPVRPAVKSVLVRIDSNGGANGFVTLATLEGVAAGSLTADNLQTT
jgi:hypothetical protein